MTRLDQLIEGARAATVDRDAAERYVRELDRWARPPSPERRWRWLLVGAGLTAAAATVALVVLRPAPPAPVAVSIDPVRIGPRVALVADPDSRYRVVQADRDTTLVELERGAITARLWPGAPHRLSLSGLGVTANAVGTVYSLALRDGRPVVHVDEGIVEIRAADGIHMVRAAETWPTAGVPADPSASTALLRLDAPPDAPLAAAPPDDAAIPEDAAVAEDATVPDAPHAKPVTAPAPTPIKDRWRQARLLRGQGKFADALAECIAIGDARDPTWSPIALVEAVRIALGPLSDPERAVTLADRALHDWPAATLATEARVLRCRALSQLGRPCN